MFAGRQKGVIENVIGHVVALGDGRRLVELPMDPQIDPALAIFFFCLGESVESPRHEGAGVAGIIFGHTIEFIGHKGERNVVGAKKPPHYLKDGAAETTMPGWITGKWRSKIRAGEIT